MQQPAKTREELLREETEKREIAEELEEHRRYLEALEVYYQQHPHEHRVTSEEVIEWERGER